MIEKFVYEPTDLRSLAAEMERMNTLAGATVDQFYLVTRYVPRALIEAAMQIEKLTSQSDAAAKP